MFEDCLVGLVLVQHPQLREHYPHEGVEPVEGADERHHEYVDGVTEPCVHVLVQQYFRVPFVVAAADYYVVEKAE